MCLWKSTHVEIQAKKCVGGQVICTLMFTVRDNYFVQNKYAIFHMNFSEASNAPQSVFRIGV